MTASTAPAPRVGLFTTCLMNLFRPNLGFAAVRLLEQAGCQVNVPARQTCCGQPGYNAGDDDAARALARQVIDTFADCDYVVGPSGSCLAMLRRDYPALLAADPAWRARAQALAARSYELTAFLTDLRGLTAVSARYDGIATYHDSCSGLRRLNIQAQPRRLLASVVGLQLREMRDAGVCCGFGGGFSVEYPDLSLRMVDDKLAQVTATGADTLLGGDLGCLMNVAGRLARQGSPIRVFHVAEVLAGMANGPAIGAPRGAN